MRRNIQLLVVDDNAATRYSLRRRLERHGYTVLEAGTGTDGLALIASETIDLLILDVNLPDMSGFDIVRLLRADSETALLPVIHVSAASIHTTDIITGLDAGADAYLIHPIDPDVLLATIRTLLRVRDTEYALRESEARFREIFANIAAPIAVIDAALNVHECNHAFGQLLGDGGHNTLLVDCFAPGQDDVLRELRARLAINDRWKIILHMRVGGQLCETEWQIAPYRTSDLALVFVEDVTEQRQRERSQLKQLDTAKTQLAREVAERVRTEAQLLQAQKMDALGKLTGGIAHDFNNLLTGIITGIELMKQRIEENRTDGAMRFADMALSSARSAATLTYRLLAFARKQPLDAQSIAVNDHVLSLEDLLRRTIGERIALTLDLTSKSAIAQVDANQLESAILNLVINARDALPEGGSIDISTFETGSSGDLELADGDYIGLSVRDNGVGIDPAVIDKVFDPFFTTKPLGKGTGLGLSTIYGFARQSGGEVRISSEAGKGTEVTLLLPAGKGSIVAQAKNLEIAPRGAGEHILLVEDMPAVRMLVAEMLADAGYRCTEAGEVETALSVLQDDATVDLLLTDVGLPRMNGRQLADAARGWQPNLPILFMTGYAENAINRESFLGDGMEMVVKPFQPGELLSKVRTMLEQNPSGTAG